MDNVSGTARDEPVDLRRLQQFLCVAEHSGFTRAAAELHLSQQALSSSVAKLEAQLGVALFDRSGRQVSLTRAGAVLREGAVVLLSAAQSLARQVRAAAARTARPFVVAHTPAITADEVHDLLAPIRVGMPEVSVTAMQLFPDALEPALLDGSIDLALRRGIATPKNLASAVIAYHPLRIAVPADHPLASEPSVAISELRSERIVVWAPPGSSFYTDFILSTCRRAGFEPSLLVNRIQGTPPVTAVLDNDGLAFVTAPAGPALAGRVAVLDVDDPPLVPTQALWLPHTVSPIRDLLTTSEPGAARTPTSFSP
jgi:DNA-binding transcriptional LysR family regulator